MIILNRCLKEIFSASYHILVQMAPQKNTPDEVSDKTSALKASAKTVK